MNLQALSWMQCCHASRTRALDKADARLCCFPEAWDVRVMSVYVHARARACVCVCVRRMTTLHPTVRVHACVCKHACVCVDVCARERVSHSC